MDNDRVDLVLQYVLAAAGERDGGEREVTATQLMKYAYLADVAHAERNGGATFTAAPWTFTGQGPQAPELEARIAPLARRIGASTRGTYYFLDRDDLGHRRAATLALPAVVINTLLRALRSFSHDTNALLAHVYATAPMRRALPGAPIDFTPAAVAPAAPPEPPPAALSPRTRAALKARRGLAVATAVSPAYAPRYDDPCFVSGQQALDAPERALIEMKGSLTIDPAVWTAPGRVGP